MKTRMSTMFVAAFLCGILVCLTGCGKTTASGENQLSGAIGEQAVQVGDEQIEEDAQDAVRDTSSLFDVDEDDPYECDISEIDDAGENIWVLNGDTLTMVDSECSYPYDQKPDESGDKAILVPRDDDRIVAPVLLDASRGDILVTTDSGFDEFMLQPIDYECYYSMDVSQVTNWWLPYEEIEGTACKSDEDAEKILKKSGARLFEVDAGWSSKTNWIADEPLEIVAGGYDGTEWTEEDIEFDTPCAITKKIDTDDYVGKVTKTRDGYFVLDTSKFKPGKYVLSFYNPNNWYGGQTNLFNGAYMITIA